MTRRTVQANGLSYLFAPDDQLPLGKRPWALMRAQVLDELTGKAPGGPITFASDAPATTPHVGGDGMVGLIGVPREVLPVLAKHNYAVAVSVQAAGYLPLQATVEMIPQKRSIAPPPPPAGSNQLTLDDAARLGVGELLLVGSAVPPFACRITALGPGADQLMVEPPFAQLFSVGDPVVPVIPADFMPPLVGPLLLHREPTVICGRVTTMVNDAAAPVEGAQVTLTGIWRTVPPLHVTVNPDAPNLVSLRPPLYAARRKVVDTLSTPSLTVQPASAALTADVPEGALRLPLSELLGVSANGILVIDGDDPNVAEYLTVASVDQISRAVTPLHATAFLHRKGARVRKVVAVAGAQKSLGDDALAGDSSLFLTDMTGVVNGGEISIAGGNAEEFHLLSTFTATSDPDGFYRLPPLSRVAQVRIKAEKGALAAAETDFCPDYALSENRLDFTLH